MNKNVAPPHERPLKYRDFRHIFVVSHRTGSSGGTVVVVNASSEGQHNNMYMQLSDRIRAARRVKHWSQAVLAKKLGVHASAVGHWERGSAGSAPSAVRLFELARLTGINAQWLAVGTGPMCDDTYPDAATPLLALCRDEEYLLRCFRRLSGGSRAYVLAFAEHQASGS